MMNPSPLLGDRTDSNTELQLDWKRVPFAEMKKRGWIHHVPREASEAKRVLDSWMAPVRIPDFAPLYRRHVRSTKAVNQEGLIIWTAQISKRALAHQPSGKFDSTWS